MERGIVISVDTMGGDQGPKAIIRGLSRCLRQNNQLRFILHGDEKALNQLLRRRFTLAKRCEIHHSDQVVSMEQKPVDALRHGRGTSMWNALRTVAKGDASAIVSSGNTGALMAMSLVTLKKAPDVDRPAIAVLWPSRSPAGFNIALDMGAGVEADANNLADFAIMGAEYARIALKLETPRVGILNIGIERGKGTKGLQEAADFLTRLARDKKAGFDFVGYVEAHQIPGKVADVIVTDGFSGNIALKSAEGTARLVREGLMSALRQTVFSRVGALFAYRSLSAFNKKIDPRRVNGGVFLGLNGLVVKSHGRADAVGFASAVKLAAQMARENFSKKIGRQLQLAGTTGCYKSQNSRRNLVG